MSFQLWERTSARAGERFVSISKNGELALSKTLRDDHKHATEANIYWDPETRSIGIEPLAAATKHSTKIDASGTLNARAFAREHGLCSGKTTRYKAERGNPGEPPIIVPTAAKVPVPANRNGDNRFMVATGKKVEVGS